MQRKFSIAVAIIILASIGFYVINRNKPNVKPKAQASASIGTSVGKIAPDFTITTIKGEKINRASLRGKIVVITSAAAWCPTCVMEAKAFAPVYQEYKERGVAFITIDIDPRDQEDFIRQFAKDYHTPWYYASSQGGADLIRDYALNRFEITYIIDQNNIIRFKDNVITSTEKLKEEIGKLL